MHRIAYRQHERLTIDLIGVARRKKNSIDIVRAIIMSADVACTDVTEQNSKGRKDRIPLYYTICVEAVFLLNLDDFDIDSFLF